MDAPSSQGYLRSERSPSDDKSAMGALSGNGVVGGVTSSAPLGAPTARTRPPIARHTGTVRSPVHPAAASGPITVVATSQELVDQVRSAKGRRKPLERPFPPLKQSGKRRFDLSLGTGQVVGRLPFHQVSR